MAVVPGGGCASRNDSASGAQVIGDSLRFNKDEEQYLTRTPSSAGNQTTFTWSVWVKRDVLADGSSDVNHNPVFCAGNSGSASTDWRFQNTSSSNDDEFWWVNWDGGTTYFSLESTPRYRDINGFYHIVGTYDGTTAKVYINGTQVTAFNTNTQNGGTSKINSTSAHSIGCFGQGTLAWFGGRMSQFYLIDGQALDPTDFGFTDGLTNTWRPKKYTGAQAPNSLDKIFSANYAASDSFQASAPKLAAFDGNISSRSACSSSGCTVTVSSMAVTVNKKLEIYSGYGAASVNGGTAVSFSGSDRAWQDLSFTGTLNTIAVTGNASGGNANAGEIYAIRVDGVILVDGGGYGINGCYLPFDGNAPIGQDESGRGNDWTPKNFACSAPVDKATGALPILNTVSGGNVATAGVRTDAYSSSLVLALPLIGHGNDVSNQINSGSSTSSLTNSGVDFVTTYSNFYGGSGDFTGAATDTLYTGDDDTKFKMEEEDFTVECWVYSTTTSGTQNVCQIIGNSGSSKYYGIWWNGTNLYFQIEGGCGSVSAGAVVMGNEKWQHLAMTRTGGKMRGFVDGVKLVEASDTLDIDDTGYQAWVGRHESANNGFTGYMQDFRIYKGVAKYTSDFIPASTDPDIQPASPSGGAYSSKLTKVTAGGVGFDGSGDYLTVGGWGSDLALGTGDFTIEFFIYPNESSPNNKDVFSNPGGVQLFFVSGKLRYNHALVTGLLDTDDIIPQGKWTHCALVRNSGTTRWYVDGVQDSGSYSDSKDWTQTTSWYVASYNGASQDLACFVSNLRVVKGTAVYTASFIPPTSPLTTITNTKLLCCQGSNAYNYSPVKTGTALLNMPLNETPFDDDSSTGATVTNTGSISATSAGTNNFNISNAASFNGSSQRITTNNSNITLTGDWTIDAWIKLDSSASGYNAIYNSGYGSQTSNYIYVGLDDDEKPYLEGGSAGSRTTASNAINKNQWYHFRAIQAAGSMLLYVDGEKVVTHGQNTTDMSSAGSDTIGSLNDNTNNANNFHGLIGPVRVVGSTLGPPPVGGEVTTAGALSNTPDIALGVAGNAASITSNPFNTDISTVIGRPSLYATWNPLWMGTSNVAISENNLLWKTTSNGPDHCTYSTIGMDSGKFYWENEIVEATATAVGIANNLSDPDGGPGLAHNWMYYSATGQVYLDNNASSYGAAYNTNGIMIGVAFDRDNLTLEFFREGKSQGKLTGITGLSDTETYYAMCGDSGGASQSAVRANFGQKPFRYTPPDGFGPLCSANLSLSDVPVMPSDYFGATLYDGTGSGPQYVNAGFKPDMVWIKSTDNSWYWNCYDSVRGSGKPGTDDAAYYLGLNDITVQSNVNAVSGTQFQGFYGEEHTNSGGYIPHYYTGGSGQELNTSGASYLGYCFKAGGGTGAGSEFWIDDKQYGSAAAAGLDGGNATPTGASVGTKQGFSIIKYIGNDTAGNTISHGLSAAPNFIIIKNATQTYAGGGPWVVGSSGMQSGAWTHWLRLDDTAAEADNDGMFNDTAPTSSVVTFGGSWYTNESIETYIMYCWHDVTGLQKFGSYVGNGSSNGPYIECGFRPALIIYKRATDGTENWQVYDDRQNPSNQSNTRTSTNLSTGAVTGNGCDILSDGFKIRNSDSADNTDGKTYIYAAWAYQPEHNLYGGQSNAR